VTGLLTLPTDNSKSFRIAWPRRVCDKSRECDFLARAEWELPRDVHAARLVRHRRLPRNYLAVRTLLPARIGKKHGGLFCIRATRLVVACGYIDGCDYVRRRYATCRCGPRVYARNCRKLDLVGVSVVGNDDSVLVRAALATIGIDDGRAIRGNALLREASCVLAWISRSLPRPDDELPDPRLGDEGNDKYRVDDARSDDDRVALDGRVYSSA